jgi:cytochrome P450
VSQSGPPAHIVPTLKEIASRGWPRPNTMLTADPPVHTRYRRLVSQAFGPRRVEALRPTITRVCDDLAAAIAARAGDVVDMVPAYCAPIPATVVAIALGVPEERFADFKRWADASVAPIGRTLDDAGWIEYAEGVVELQHFFAGEFEARRAEPRDDLLTDLLDGTLEMAELLSIVQQLQVAGSETTASLIADAIVFLADQPGEWDRIAADPSRAAPVVEECLRLSSPYQGLYRTVTTDTELGGAAIPKGSTVWVLHPRQTRETMVGGLHLLWHALIPGSRRYLDRWGNRPSVALGTAGARAITQCPVRADVSVVGDRHRGSSIVIIECPRPALEGRGDRAT